MLWSTTTLHGLIQAYKITREESEKSVAYICHAVSVRENQGGFPHKGSVMQSFDIYFVVSLQMVVELTVELS